MTALSLGRLFRLGSLFSAWTLAIPATLQWLVTAPSPLADPGSWLEHTITMVMATLAAGTVLSVSWLALARPAPLSPASASMSGPLATSRGTGQLPPMVGWLIGVLVLAAMGAAHWYTGRAIAEFLSFPLAGAPTDTSLLLHGGSWLVLGAMVWGLRSTFHSHQSAYRAVRLVSARLEAMEQSDRVRLEGALRGLLASVARQVNRVVSDMNHGAPVQDFARTRSLPDSEQDFVKPLTRLVGDLWAPRKTTQDPTTARGQEEDPTPPESSHAPPPGDTSPKKRPVTNHLGPQGVWQTVSPPRPLALTALLAGVALIGAGAYSRGEWVAVGITVAVVAVLSLVVSALFPRLIPEKQPALLQAITAIVLAGVLTVLGAWLPHVFYAAINGGRTNEVSSGGFGPADQIVDPVTLAALALGVLTIMVWHAVAQRMRQGWSNTTRDIIEHSQRVDDVARKLDVLHRVEPRVLYSATLGTLIRTTVDLTATEVSPLARERALGEMARRITAELDNLRLQGMPLPEDHILSMFGMWHALLGVDTEVNSRVFSRLSWTAEGIRDINATVAAALAWTVSQPRGAHTVECTSDGAQVEIMITLPQVRPAWVSAHPVRVITDHLGPSRRVALELTAEGAGSVLSLRWTPRQVEETPWSLSPQHRSEKDANLDEALAEPEGHSDQTDSADSLSLRLQR